MLLSANTDTRLLMNKIISLLDQSHLLESEVTRRLFIIIPVLLKRLFINTGKVGSCKIYSNLRTKFISQAWLSSTCFD